MADLIEANYILPEVASKVAETLRKNAMSGRYSKYSGSPEKLAEAITRDIKGYSLDDHMYVEYVWGDVKQDNWIEQWLANAPSKNFGIKKIEILDGNIGYLSVTSFYPLDIAKPTIQAAMELLKHTEGMILDLRGNGGGHESSTKAFLTTFLPEGHKHPLDIESREKRMPIRIPSNLDWDRYAQHKKLVIIVNGRTFSAPESLAFSLQEIGRALVVGSNSGGGAHMTDNPKKISGGYEIGIPNQRPISKTSGKNWEGIGVIPDVKTGGLDEIDAELKQFISKKTG